MLSKPWGTKGSSNVGAHGALDKRQSTGTPWINYLGEIIFFHTTLKGKTDRCLPPKTFRDKEVFKAPAVPILFGYSDNHWVSKSTMKQQIIALEDHRKRVVARKKLDKDAKVLILWDVYCRHRDADLLDWMKKEFPNIIVIFVPANLTELGQPLDIFFNSMLKTKLYKLRNEQNAAEAIEVLDLMEDRPTTAAAIADQPQHAPKKLLSELKEPFYLNLATVLKEMQTPEAKELISRKAWKTNLFEKCFDRKFQAEAVKLVEADKEFKYFHGAGSDTPKDPTISTECQGLEDMTADLITEDYDNNNNSRESDDTAPDKSFVGRQVQALGGKYPGTVSKFAPKAKEFTVRYTNPELESSRARKVVQMSRDELMNLLVYPTPDDLEEELEKDPQFDQEEEA